jgi:hypothetical protein
VAGSFGGQLPGGRPGTGPNGTLWTFEALDAGEILPLLAEVRPDRLLFFQPADSLGPTRTILEAWDGGSRTDATYSRGVGPVSTADLPALIILKIWLEGKVIEAGWSGLVDLSIQGTEGSMLSIDGDPVRSGEVRAWIDRAGDAFASDDSEGEFSRLRTAAGVEFDRLRRELQILLWQRAPEGEIPPPGTVSLARFRNFLAIYYQAVHGMAPEPRQTSLAIDRRFPNDRVSR